MLLLNFHLCHENIVVLIVGKITKVFPLLLPQKFLNDLNHMLNTSITDAPNFIRISISNMKKSYLKLPTNYLAQSYVTVSLISYFLYITIKPQILLNLKYTNLWFLSRRTNHLKMCAVFFLKKERCRIYKYSSYLRDPDIVKSLPSSSVKFLMPMVTFKLTPPIFTKFFNFNKFVNILDLDSFLTNPDSFNKT